MHCSITMSSESLQTLFSDSSKNNFARLFKPVEFVKKNKVEDVPPVLQNGATVSTAKISNGVITTVHEKDARTCFVGNIGTSQNKKSIIKIFKEFGEIDSIRLRSVPIEGTAVDEDGNQNLVKKVCSNKQKFGDQKGSFNAYVVYKEIESVQRAVSATNNQFFGERHIRVDNCVPSILDPKSTLFIGSLPFYADEEELRDHFATVRHKGGILYIFNSQLCLIPHPHLLLLQCNLYVQCRHWLEDMKTLKPFGLYETLKPSLAKGLLTFHSRIMMLF